MQFLRRTLDGLYAASAVLAVLFLVMIGVLTAAQMASRLLGFSLPSADDFAGFWMAGSVFMGLTYTLRVGSHIRVLTLVTRVGPLSRRALEIFCVVIAVAIVSTLTWYVVDMILVTRRLGEYTLGLVPVPKWIPMLLMFAGLLVFLIALVDALVVLLRGGEPSYMTREEESGAAIRSSAE
jgi:TRAP-type C4-dicarboxylate transport system permease small subunit